MIYSSRQNALIKEIASLKDKKYRQKLGLYLAEGVKMVNEAVRYNADVKYVVSTSAALSSLNVGDTRVIEVTDDVFSFISDAETPQGALAVIKIPCGDIKPPKGNALLLDGVADPGNMGTIIRTAAAFGFNDLYLINCVDPYGCKVVRASMSGIYFVNVYKTNVADAFEALRDVNVIVADMNGKDLNDFSVDGKRCVVIGNEANGVSDVVKNKADFVVGIPMAERSESLNAGVAAAIMMYKLKTI